MISEFAFQMVDPSYPRRAREAGDHAIIGGRNYGQGSSREHAALAPRYLGLRVVIAKGFARIHWQNLVNFGILPLTLDDEVEYDRLELGDILQLRDLHKQIRRDRQVEVRNATRGRTFTASHALSERQIEVLFAGGLIRWARARL